MKRRYYFLLLLIAAGINSQLSAQIKTPQPSPVQTLKQEFGLVEAELSYSRPSAKGRTVYGDLVPFGKMWRTGANASSKIKFSDDVTFGGVKVTKGEYALYTIPGQTEWSVILYKDLTCWGVCEEYSQDKEAARVTVKTKAIPMTETFTMNFENITTSSATLRISWEKTAVDVLVEHDVDSKVMASINSFMNPKPDYRPYFNAAAYYLETSKDLNEALKWVNKAYELNQAFWVSHLKAKIQYAMKDYKGAIESAELSKATAIKEKNDDYVALNDKLIEKARAAK